MTYVRALKGTLLGTALPYGFTVTLLSSSQVLISLRGRPDVGQIYLFAAGAAFAYGVLRVVLNRFEPAGSQPSQSPHPIRAGIVHVAAIGGGIGAATLVGLIDSGLAWPLGGFLAMLVYLVTSAVETAVQAESDSG